MERLSTLNKVIESLIADNPLVLQKFIYTATSSTTPANSNCGYISSQRFFSNFVVPAPPNGYSGYFFHSVDVICSSSGTYFIVGLEYQLGELNYNTNTFTPGVSMPIKTIEGESVQTATPIVFAVVTSTLSSSATQTTITYTNQSGATGRSLTMTLPASASTVSSFILTPHLQSGDSAIRAITNAQNAAPTSGNVKYYGILPIGISILPAAYTNFILPNYWRNIPKYICEEGETITVYRSFAATAALAILATLTGQAV